jgi:hypothetical protein
VQLIRTPFLCKRGWHKWRFIYMTNLRSIYKGAHTQPLCEITESCRRCGRRRTRYAAKVPKRVRA